MSTPSSQPPPPCQPLPLTLWKHKKPLPSILSDWSKFTTEKNLMHVYADMCGEGSVSLLVLQLVKDAFLGHDVLLQSTAILGSHGDKWNLKF